MAAHSLITVSVRLAAVEGRGFAGHVEQVLRGYTLMVYAGFFMGYLAIEEEIDPPATGYALALVGIAISPFLALSLVPTAGEASTLLGVAGLVFRAIPVVSALPIVLTSTSHTFLPRHTAGQGSLHSILVAWAALNALVIVAHQIRPAFVATDPIVTSRDALARSVAISPLGAPRRIFASILTLTIRTDLPQKAMRVIGAPTSLADA